MWIKMRTERTRRKMRRSIKMISNSKFCSFIYNVSCLAFLKLNDLNTWVSEIKNRLIFFWLEHWDPLGDNRKEDLKVSVSVSNLPQLTCWKVFLTNVWCESTTKTNRPEHHCLTKANFLIMFLVVRCHIQRWCSWNSAIACHYLALH